MSYWGYYGRRGGYEPMNLDRIELTSSEKEEALKRFLMARAAKMRKLGIKPKPKDELPSEICPRCHCVRALNGSCSC